MSKHNTDTDTELDTEDLPVQDELDALKARADMLGVKYHPSISLEKLRTKVTDAMSDEPDSAPKVKVQTPDVEVEETAGQRRARMKREANQLVRIRITCMNPAKKEWEGEIFTVGNSLVGSFTKFIPFNADDGWHVPKIIYNQLVDRQCQIFTTVKDRSGNSIRRGKLIKEFAIEVLPPLTMDELKELGRRQAMANGATV